jgi:hypothetical protein
MKNFKVTLEITGNKYEVEAKSIDSALEKIGLKWNQIKGKGILKISSKDSYFERMFFIKQLRRMFTNKLTRQLWAKRMEFLMKKNIFNQL